MFGLTSLFIFTLLVVLVMMLLFAGSVLGGVLFTAWLLVFLTDLTFAQASILSGMTAATFIWYEQREFDLHPFNLVMLVVLATPIVDLVLVGMAWVVARFFELDLMQATLLTGGIGLSSLYNIMARVSSLPDYLLDDDEDFENDFENDEDYNLYHDEDEDEDESVDGNGKTVKKEDIDDIVNWLYSRDPKKKKK